MPLARVPASLGQLRELENQPRPSIIQGQETYMAKLKIRASCFACVSDIRLKIESASCH